MELVPVKKNRAEIWKEGKRIASLVSVDRLVAQIHAVLANVVRYVPQEIYYRVGRRLV